MTDTMAEATEALTEARRTLFKASSLLTAFELGELPNGTVERNGTVIWDDVTHQDIFAIARELVDKGESGVSLAIEILG